MKKLLSVITLGIAFTVANPVLSHSEKPRHGGVVAQAKDLNFELVSQEGKAMIYILDHGQPVDTAHASGKLTVLNGNEKTEVNLQPAGENRLASTAEVVLRTNAKVIASIILVNKKRVAVRFLVN